MNAQNPQWANAAHTLIDCQIEHPIYGVIPFTASPNDVEEHGRDLFARAAAGEFGPVADYVPPPAPPAPPEPEAPATTDTTAPSVAME